MDMGFVQGTKFTTSDTDGKEVTILDRFNLSTYHALSSQVHKSVPNEKKITQVETIHKILQIHGAKSTRLKHIQTDNR